MHIFLHKMYSITERKLLGSISFTHFAHTVESENWFLTFWRKEHGLKASRIKKLINIAMVIRIVSWKYIQIYCKLKAKKINSYLQITLEWPYIY